MVVEHVWFPTPSPVSARLMKTPRRATLSPEGARAGVVVAPSRNVETPEAEGGWAGADLKVGATWRRRQDAVPKALRNVFPWLRAGNLSSLLGTIVNRTERMGSFAAACPKSMMGLPGPVLIPSIGPALSLS